MHLLFVGLSSSKETLVEVLEHIRYFRAIVDVVVELHSIDNFYIGREHLSHGHLYLVTAYLPSWVYWLLVPFRQG